MKTLDILAFLGVLLGMGMTGVMLWTFMTAYSSPDKATTVLINSVGEANWEVVAFPVVFLLTLFACGRVFQRLLQINK